MCKVKKNDIAMLSLCQLNNSLLHLCTRKKLLLNTVHCLLHSFQYLFTIFFDTGSEHLQFCIQEIQHLQKEHSHAVSQWSEHFFLFSNIVMSDESIPSNKKCFKELIRWQCSFSRVTADLKYSRSLHLQWYFRSLRHLSHGIETLLA